MQREKQFCINAFREQERTFESYLFEMAKALFLEAIERLDADKKLRPLKKEFDAEFYASGVCGVVIAWAEKGMKISPEVMAAHLKSLAKDTERFGYVRLQGEL